MRPRIRTAALTGYPGLARSLGLDPAEFAAAVGLTVGDLDASDRWIPAAPVAHLLELSAQRSGAQDFALRLAEYRGLGTLGPLSVVLRNEPDLRGVLDLLVRYERVYNEALHLRITRDEPVVTVSAWLQFGEPAPTGQGLDLVMAALVGIVRTLVGNDWEPLSVSFTHAAPADPEPYRRLFGRVVRFGAPSTDLALHGRDLDLPVVTSDPSVRPYTQQYLRTVVAPGETTATAQVAEALELLLPLGRASADEVTRTLGLRPRELQRSLAEEGQTFSAVVHEVRARLAERHLSADGASLTRLSQQLGFAAPSAFSRWFRQQFGTSPSDWRRAAAAGTAGSPLVPCPREPEDTGESTGAP